MLPRPETQDPMFSIQIVNAYSAESSRLTRRKVTKKLLNTSFRQWQFATLCRSSSDHDVIACSQGSLVISPKPHRLTPLVRVAIFWTLPAQALQERTTGAHRSLFTPSAGPTSLRSRVHQGCTVIGRKYHRRRIFWRSVSLLRCHQ